MGGSGSQDVQAEPCGFGRSNAELEARGIAAVARLRGLPAEERRAALLAMPREARRELERHLRAPGRRVRSTGSGSQGSRHAHCDQDAALTGVDAEAVVCRGSAARSRSPERRRRPKIDQFAEDALVRPKRLADVASLATHLRSLSSEDRRAILAALPERTRWDLQFLLTRQRRDATSASG